MVLYAFVGPFLGTVLTGVVRDQLAGLAGDAPEATYLATGAVVGLVFAALVAVGVGLWLARPRHRERARLQRRHTAALGGPVVAFLSVAVAVAPGLFGLGRRAPESGRLVGATGPVPGAPWAPVVAAGATLAVLAVAYVGLRRRAATG